MHQDIRVKTLVSTETLYADGGKSASKTAGDDRGGGGDSKPWAGQALSRIWRQRFEKWRRCWASC